MVIIFVFVLVSVMKIAWLLIEHDDDDDKS